VGAPSTFLTAALKTSLLDRCFEVESIGCAELKSFKTKPTRASFFFVWKAVDGMEFVNVRAVHMSRLELHAWS
jgi:hypothetical protein